METREAELSDLKSYLVRIDKEVTMMLQSLQWDRNHLLEGEDMDICSVNAHHRVPCLKKQVHERECVLASHGGSNNALMLPDPADENAVTLVTFNKDMIHDIIVNASQADSQFKRGHGHTDPVEPLTLDRLQSTYTSDERRAIHDAVVAAAPEHGDLADLPLASLEERKAERAKSKLQVLCELRDMKRRRVKYRVATKGGNYSDVLRVLIGSQMELFSEVKNKTQNVQCNSDHGTNSEFVKEIECGHISNKSETGPSETFKYKESGHDKLERIKEEGAREKYHRDDNKRRDDRDRTYERSYRNEKSSRNKDKHFEKEYAVRKGDEQKVRDKQDYRTSIGSSSKHDNERKEKDYRKFEHERNFQSVKRNEHYYSQEKYESVRVKTERESASPGSSKDWKSYKERARRKEESRSYEKNKNKSRENWEDHKRYRDADKTYKRYHEFDDTNEDRKRRKKHSEDKYRD